jgi:hypothetical protein
MKASCTKKMYPLNDNVSTKGLLGIATTPELLLAGLSWTSVRPGVLVNGATEIKIGADGNWYVSLTPGAGVVGPFRSLETAAEGVQRQARTGGMLFVPHDADPTL